MLSQEGFGAEVAGVYKGQDEGLDLSAPSGAKKPTRDVALARRAPRGGPGLPWRVGGRGDDQGWVPTSALRPAI